MTPKEKAEELVIKYLKLYVPDESHVIILDGTILTSKNHFHIGYFAKCALIAVDEILQADMLMMTEEMEIWWEEVRKEIENL